MTGYTNTNAAGSQVPPTGSVPAQSDTAAQGGYLGKAQGWTNRVTNNLQGQAEHLKGKFAGSGATGQGSTTGTGLNTTGTRTGYEPTGTGTGYSSSTGTGTTGYTDPNPNSGYSTGGNQPGVAHGHNAHLSQGYAPAQATSGTATDGTYGNAAQKPSYTDQAKSWTAKVADNLHGQAEYLKNKVAGPSTAGQPTGTGIGYSQGTATGSGPGFNQGSGTGYSQGAGTPAYNQGTHVGQTQGTGAGATPGYGQGTDYSGARQTQTHTGAPDPQAKKSWTDTAKQGIVGGLGYTQSGLEYVKNKVGGPTGSTGTGNTGTGNTGSSYSTGQPTTGTTTNPNQRY